MKSTRPVNSDGFDISRFTPPSIRKAVDRHRLFKKIDRHNDKKVVFVIGQAAQGKSTLIATYLKQSGLRYSWINLTSDDSDPVTLYYSIIHSLRYSLPEMDFSIFLEFPGINLGPRDESLRFNEWFQSLFERLKCPVRIVFDGLDRLPPDAESINLLKVLIDKIPANIQCFILSRIQPSLEIQKMKMNQEAFILDNNELAFSLREISAFLSDIRGLRLSRGQLEKIHHITTGWIGGGILLSNYLENLNESEHRQAIIGDLPDEFRIELYRYFGEEIFFSLHPDTQKFLIESSVLDAIEPDAISSLFPVINVSEVLESLISRNLFVYSTYDSEKGTVYYYHQLFKDFLKNKFNSTLNEKERKIFIVRLAKLFKHKKSLELAIRYFLKAEQYDEAASLLEKIGVELIRNGRIRDLRRWLSRLPDDLTNEKPWLVLLGVSESLFTNTKQNCQVLWPLIDRFAGRKDIRGQLLSLAYLIESLTICGVPGISLEAMVGKAEELLMQTENMNNCRYEKSYLFTQISLAYNIRLGNARKAYWASQSALLIAQDISIKVLALARAMESLAYLGEFGLAHECLKKLSIIMEHYPNPEFSAIYNISLCGIFMLEGDLIQAEDAVHSAKASAEKFGLFFLYPVVLDHEQIVLTYQQRYEEANSVGRQLMELGTSLGFDFFTGMSHMLKGLAYYHQGDFAAAIDSVEHSMEIFSTEMGRARYQNSCNKIILSLCLYHLGEISEAERWLNEDFQHLTDISCFLLLTDIHFANALIKWKQYKIQDAAYHLKTGFSIASQQEFSHSIVISPDDLKKACLLALELGISEVEDYISSLMLKKFSANILHDLAPLTSYPRASVRETARRIRTAVYRSTLPKIYIETLSNFQVMRGSEVVDDKAWAGGRPKMLLKYILSHHPQKVSREQIKHDLWPEAKDSAARNTLKITLHRLRKALEPTITKDVGSSYIHLENDRIFLDETLCEIDFGNFLSLFDQASQKKKEGNLNSALLLYQEAVSFYPGDFLPNDTSLDAIEVMRLRLKERFISTLNEIAEIYEQRGARKSVVTYYKRILRIDPLYEYACQRLMTMYSFLNKTNEAIKVYHSYKEALWAQLNTSPDPATECLFKKIIEKN